MDLKAVLAAGQRHCSETPVTRLTDRVDCHRSHHDFYIRISSQPSRSRRTSAIYNCRLPRPIFAPLCPSCACHPAPHFHFKTCPLSHHSVAGLEMCSGARRVRRVGKLIGTRKFGQAPPLELCVGGAIFSLNIVSFFLTLETAQGWLFGVVLRSLAWTIAKEPLRKYNPPVEGQRSAPIERPLTISNVLLDALDLVFNLRGIGWSWSHKPYPKTSTWSTSIPSVLAKLLLKFVAFDISHYLIQRIRPSVNDPAGDTIFDSTLSTVPCFALAAFCTICGAMMVYTMVDMFYLILSLIGRILLRQSAWQWPPLFERPWASTSVSDFWSFRWHQTFRYVFVALGSRPGGAILGRPGALLGAFAVSGVFHDLGMWGLGKGIGFSSVSGFFLLMGVGTILEYVFKQATGHRVGGLLGWVWTMVWSVGWGTMIIDPWSRGGLMASDFFPFAPRPGKWLVDAIIPL